MICTEPFRALAELNARAKGVPDLDVLIIPHPLGVRPEAEVELLGREVARLVLDLAERVAA